MTSPDLTTTSAGTTWHTSRADVATDVPGRYAKQLVSHLGRKVTFVEEQGSWTATVLGSVARITVGDGVLVLQAEAPDSESLARLEHALGSHLERFGQRNALTVTWQRSTSTPA
ncbi:MAG TPA: DUF2218 domain-containing protein [Streptomyces sp.]|uniref:DUF2218 domain-containing protein n=1 Tax=Streptomyces sp. TaxID=1931 RepID=UPI002CA040A3|nr:DUF2218 domain-containing protein [Streptomyces sp.]HWU08253.1 DUF2218 domain-containing protein [Streptomyces sp.]